MAKAALHETDSLSSYLRQIGQLEPLSTEEQQNLCSEFELYSGKLRSALTVFGFVGDEYLRLINECIGGSCEPSDIFLPSSLKKCGGKNQIPEMLNSSRAEINSALSALRENFFKGGDTSVLRADLSRALSCFDLSLSTVNEHLEVALGYIRMVDPDFDPLTRRLKVNWSEVSSDTRELLERKFLMDCDMISEEIKKISQICRMVHELRNRLLEANLRLVISIAQRYCNRGVPFNDLIQEGNLGLLRALERFDFQLGYKFSTYASWWIRHNISRVIAEQSRVIRLPGHMIKSINDINRAEQRFLQLNGREPEIEELAKMLELPVARVSAIRKMSVQTISLQSPVGDENDGMVLEDLIADTSGYEPTRELSRKFLYDRLYEMLRTLPEREQQIIIMRFGFFGQPCMPLTDISRHFNLTRERVRQLEIKILTSLRSPERLKYIDGCVHLEDF